MVRAGVVFVYVWPGLWLGLCCGCMLGCCLGCGWSWCGWFWFGLCWVGVVVLVFRLWLCLWGSGLWFGVDAVVWVNVGVCVVFVVSDCGRGWVLWFGLSSGFVLWLCYLLACIIASYQQLLTCSSKLFRASAPTYQPLIAFAVVAVAMAPKYAAAHHAAARRSSAVRRIRGEYVARQMKMMDWVSRHSFYHNVTTVTRGGPDFATELQHQLGPDELLLGKLTGVSSRAIIICKDKAGYRQLQLTEVGFYRRPARQTILDEYGIVRGTGR